MKNNNLIWKHSKIKSIYFNFLLCSKDDFRKLINEIFDRGNKYSILVRVEYDENSFGMIGTQIPFNYKDYDEVVIDEIFDKIINRLIEFKDRYNINYYDSIQILFVQIEALPKLSLENINNINISNLGINTRDIKSRYSNKFLPLTTNTIYFGKLILDGKEFINKINESKDILSKPRIKTNDYDNIYLYNNYIILNKEIKHNVFVREIYDYNLGIYEGQIMDSILDNKSFIRMYNNKISLKIVEDKVSLLSIYKELPNLTNKNVKSSKGIALVSTPKIGTFDIEVFDNFEGYGEVYAAGFCTSLDEKPIMYYYDNSYNNVLINCINKMLVNKYNGYTFYIHNLNYEAVFLIHNLKLYNKFRGYEYYKIKTFYRDNSILKLEVSINKLSQKNNLEIPPKYVKIKITFLDSNNLFKTSLRKLCKSFNINTVKGYFPYKFVKNNTLDYIGKTPSYEYWSDISKEDYNLLVKDNWNLKEECLSYLSKDLISLLEIMKSFNLYIKNKFDIDIVNCLTISRLSLDIFLKMFLNKSKIPIIKDNVYKDIKEAYYGGVTEVYIPYGKNLFYYDVNSLYPYTALNPMCGNKYTYLESFHDYLNLDELFGFFYCEIETDNNYLGLLPIKRPEGLIMPNGNWKGWYFSEELKFASTHSYKIKVIRGYNFNKEFNVFDNYVKYLYNIKSTTTNKVEKTIAKSLLNNLLGRFGLNVYKPITELVNKDKLDILLSTRECNSFKMFNENDFLVSYYPNISKYICEENGYDYHKVLEEFNIQYNKADKNQYNDISLVISAAITSYARIFMSKIKLDILNKGGKIYYTDTDSIITDIPLDDNLVGSNLGQFKLEHKIKEGYFISNKTYCLVVKDDKGNDITISKNKGIIENSLTLDDFKDLYRGIDVTGPKRFAIKTLNKGSVIIKEENIKISHNAYTKRSKIYDNFNNWINTKPLYINDNKISNKSEDDIDDDDNKTSNNKFDKISKNDKSNSIKTNYKKFIKIIFNKIVNFIKELVLIILSLFIVTFFCSEFIDILIKNNFTFITNKSMFSQYINKNFVKYNYEKRTFIQDFLIKNKSQSFIQERLNKPFIQEISIKNKPKIFTQPFRKDYSLNYLFDNIIREAIIHNIVTDSKFKDITSLKIFAWEYIINEINKGNLKITFNDLNKLINKLDIQSNNKELYKFICECEKLNSRYEIKNNNLSKFNSNLSSKIINNKSNDFNIRYNEVSENYMDNYTRWVKDPYLFKEPGNIVIHNKLSLQSELLNIEYTNLVNDIDDTINFINDILSKNKE